MKPITAEWVSKAESDFALMEREGRVRKNPSYDGVCFHAQQCAEKYLKARLRFGSPRDSWPARSSGRRRPLPA